MCDIDRRPQSKATIAMWSNGIQYTESHLCGEGKGFMAWVVTRH